MKKPFSSRYLVAALLVPLLSGIAADPAAAPTPDAMADMRAKAAAVQASAAGDKTASPVPAAAMSMGSQSGSTGMNMGGADSKAAPASSAPMTGMMGGMMGGMKGKMGEMKMSMDEMKGMANDEPMKAKMSAMQSMMSDMEGMMGKMDSMMGGMMGDASMTPGGGSMAGMNPNSADTPPSNGMRMMGAIGASSMKSALPGFPGASHLYHIGSTGFFLDHEEHIALSPEQTKALNAIAEKSRTGQADTDRQIDEANQTLFTLTGADSPAAAKIEVEISRIEKLAADRRRTFIREVGEAASVLTKEQRDILVGLPMPNQSATPKPADPAMSGGMSDM